MLPTAEWKSSVLDLIFTKNQVTLEAMTATDRAELENSVELYAIARRKALSGPVARMGEEMLSKPIQTRDLEEAIRVIRLHGIAPNKIPPIADELDPPASELSQGDSL